MAPDLAFVQVVLGAVGPFQTSISTQLHDIQVMDGIEPVIMYHP